MKSTHTHLRIPHSLKKKGGVGSTRASPPPLIAPAPNTKRGLDGNPTEELSEGQGGQEKKRRERDSGKREKLSGKLIIRPSPPAVHSPVKGGLEEGL